MTDPEFSPLPTCDRCRKEAPCLVVDTALGERKLCIGACWPAFTHMRTELKRKIAALLEEHDGDFFDPPTRPDIPSLLPPEKP